MEESVLRRAGVGADVVLVFSTAHDAEPSSCLSWGDAPAIGQLTDAHVTRIPAAMIAAEPEQLRDAVDARPSGDPRRIMLVVANHQSVSHPSFLMRNPFGVRPAWARTVSRLVAEATGVRPSPVETTRSRLAQVVLLADRWAMDPRFSPETLAVALGISRRSLYLLTQDTLGGVSAIIRERRLERAVQLLLSNPELGLQTVALASGFSSLQQLNRAAMMTYAVPAAEIRRAGVIPRFPMLLDRTGA